MKLKCKKNTYTFTKGLILKSEKTVNLSMTVGKEYEICISKCLSDSGRNFLFENNSFLEEEYLLVYYSDNNKYEEERLRAKGNINEIMKELFEDPS